MARAKDILDLVVPPRFFPQGRNAQGDRHVYASRTRFIPAALTQHFECVTWPLAAAAAGTRRDTKDVRVDVGAKMRSMWRGSAPCNPFYGRPGSLPANGRNTAPVLGVPRNTSGRKSL